LKDATSAFIALNEMDELGEVTGTLLGPGYHRTSRGW
jgi:hypothetical protein